MVHMRLKRNWPLWSAAGLGCLVVSVMIANWTATESGKRATQAELRRNSVGQAIKVVLPATPAELPALPPSTLPDPSERPIPEIKSAPQTQRPVEVAQSSAEQTDDHSILDDPAAREQLGRLALSYVGADPVADEIWVWLINDPELSPKVRQDLIEDLNENGFSDGNGRRATVDDLPLIESRMLLIEEHAEFAMDDVNAAAFAEAYKDLWNMWRRLSE